MLQTDLLPSSSEAVDLNELTFDGLVLLAPLSTIAYRIILSGILFAYGPRIQSSFADRRGSLDYKRPPWRTSARAEADELYMGLASMSTLYS